MTGSHDSRECQLVQFEKRKIVDRRVKKQAKVVPIRAVLSVYWTPNGQGSEGGDG